MGYKLHIEVFLRLKWFIEVEKWSIKFYIFKPDEPLLEKLNFESIFEINCIFLISTLNLGKITLYTNFLFSNDRFCSVKRIVNFGSIWIFFSNNIHHFSSYIPISSIAYLPSTISLQDSLHFIYSSFLI